MNTSEQNLYDALEPKQQLAIDLRLSGATYKQIANDIFVLLKEHTIRTWFMEGGICKEVYEWKKKTRAEEREEYFQHVHEQINDIAMSAIFTLRKAVESGSVQASLKVLELADTKRFFMMQQTDEMQQCIGEMREIIQAQRDRYKAEFSL